MVTDKNGIQVKAGDEIKFNHSDVTYTMIRHKGVLGAYENGNFIALKDCLKNFHIVSKENL